jgi:hypothetical protein
MINDPFGRTPDEIEDEARYGYALASIRGLAVCVWGCECGRGRFWWWAGASCWSAQLFLCVLGSGLAAVGQVVAVTGGLNPIVLRHRASQ